MRRGEWRRAELPDAMVEMLWQLVSLPVNAEPGEHNPITDIYKMLTDQTIAPEIGHMHALRVP